MSEDKNNKSDGMMPVYSQPAVEVDQKGNYAPNFVRTSVLI